MKFCFIKNKLIKSFIIFFTICMILENTYSDGSIDEDSEDSIDTNSEHLIETNSEDSTEEYVDTKNEDYKRGSVKTNNKLKKINAKIGNKTKRLNIRISDKYFLSPEDANSGDMILQAEFGVSKPKPWRKDDDKSVNKNSKAEEAIDPNQSTEKPSEQNNTNNSDNEDPGVGKYLLKDCGKALATNKRIVNGKQAEVGSYPWVVAIIKMGEPWCGGSLINEFWVLTASHCFMGDMTAKHYAIRVGTVNRNVGTTYRVTKLIMHERFHLDSMFNSDIALLKVDRKIRMGKLVNAVCLPKYLYEEPVTKSALVVGWGQTSFENKDLPVMLQEVLLNRVTIQECANKYKIKGNSIYKSQLCTWMKGQDACQGDSGSPAIEWRDSTAFQIGIVSYGSTCADELPGVYTKVSYFTKWIAETIKANS